jgi:hypothetical protein
MIANQTGYAVDHAVLIDPAGRDVYVVVVKATYLFPPDGALELALTQVPVANADVFAGPPESSGLVAASEVTLPKPRVDLLLEGELAMPVPVEQIDCVLEVGRRLRKVVRVFGDRYWYGGALGAMVPCRPKLFAQMSIAWERSYGGTDPDDPSAVDLRNPVGCGLRRKPATLEGLAAPNFEDPRKAIVDSGTRPAPVGFGPVAPHWEPRRRFAGTYDESWQEERFPLLPADFDPRFLNVAPSDQQLDGYLPGEELRLTYMTKNGHESLALPELAPVVTIVDGGTLVEATATVDTVTIAPNERRICVTARVAYRPARDAGEIIASYVGALTGGQRRALEAGKPYVRAGRRKAS